MLSSGTKLGPYEILAPLGAGGMGEVYRARDTRLERTVAIKVLPSHLQSNADLKQRFEREARAISSLNHPHICTVHDVGSQGGVDFLVMELLEGETLAERLAKGTLPLDQAVRIGVEIADALDKAHRAGIVHRDLKPGNVMLTRSGAKLMDFGLAKPAGALGAVASASSAGPLTPSTPTMSFASLASPASPLTQQGTIVGTVQYMAPEQIEGKEADARSDIFSLGCVLYEMMTGKRAFQGKSQLSVATAILESDPAPPESLNPAVSPALAHVIQTCLAKDPEERFQTALDVKLELQWSHSPAARAAQTIAKKRPVWLLVTAVLVSLLAGGAATWVALRPAATQRAIFAAQVPPPPGTTLMLTGDVAAPAVLSPDGSMIVLGAGGQLWVRHNGAGTYRALDGTGSGTFPFWSPDSRSIGFFAEGKLKTKEINGGAPNTICSVATPRGGSWSSSGQIVFTPTIRDPLFKVPASGGAPVPVTKLDPALHSTHRWPFFLPDGNHFLFFAANHADLRGSSTGIYVGSLDGSQPRKLLQTTGNAIYVSGHLLFVRNADLLAQPFDARAQQLLGEPQRVAERIFTDGGIWRNAISASENGLLLYIAGDPGAVKPPSWYSDSGKLLAEVAESGANSPRLSPDGRRLAFSQGDPNPDIWIYDLTGRTRQRFTAQGQNNSPVWSPDGKKLALSRTNDQSGAGNILVAALDGNGAAETLAPGRIYQVPTDWSRDGRYILFDAGEPGATDIYAIEARAGATPFPVIKTPAWESDGHFSPDGNWLVFTSRESGRAEIYLAPFPGPGAKLQISSGGGTGARWRSDGREIYYVSDDSFIVAVPLGLKGGEVQLGEARKLFRQAVAENSSFLPSWDVSADGKKFIITNSAEESLGRSSLSLIVNWEAELKK